MPVRTEPDFVGRPTGNAQPQCSLSGGHFPGLHRRVRTGDRHTQTVGTDLANFLAGGGIPKVEERIFAGGGEISILRAKRNPQFAVPVAMQFVHKFSSHTIPDFDGAVSLCGGQAGAVGIVCQIQRLTPSFFQGRSRFSRRNVPGADGNDISGMSPMARIPSALPDHERAVGTRTVARQSGLREQQIRGPASGPSNHVRFT